MRKLLSTLALMGLLGAGCREKETYVEHESVKYLDTNTNELCDTCIVERHLSKLDNMGRRTEDRIVSSTEYPLYQEFKRKEIERFNSSIGRDVLFEAKK